MTTPAVGDNVAPGLCTVQRVAVLGAESTGKTTLCQELAHSLGGQCFPEPLREWVLRHGRSPCLTEQVLLLQEQQRIEHEAIVTAKGLGQSWVFCDSAPLMTAIYSQFYFQDGTLLRLAVDHHRRAYDYTLVCETDLRWQPDPGMRDGPAAQTQTQSLLIERLHEYGLPYFLVTGVGPSRAELAMRLITGVDFGKR